MSDKKNDYFWVTCVVFVVMLIILSFTTISYQNKIDKLEQIRGKDFQKVEYLEDRLCRTISGFENVTSWTYCKSHNDCEFNCYIGGLV